MRLTLESTPDVGAIEINGVLVPARVWCGQTGEGTRVLAFITRISPLAEEQAADLERELINVSDVTRVEITDE